MHNNYKETVTGNQVYDPKLPPEYLQSYKMWAIKIKVKWWKEILRQRQKNTAKVKTYKIESYT